MTMPENKQRWKPGLIIPDGYEVAEDPKTCTHAMLASGEVVGATDRNMVAIRLQRSGTVCLSHKDLPRLGITLLRKVPKPEPRVWEGVGSVERNSWGQHSITLPNSIPMGAEVRYRIEEVLPE